MSNNFKYIGNHCGLLHGLGYSFEGTPEENIDNWANSKAILTRNLNDNKSLNIIAITADFYQKHAHKFLNDKGFKKILCFNSYHDNSYEKLTFWIKTNPNAKNTKHKNIEELGDNCSVGINSYRTAYEGEKRLVIETKKPSKKGFKKIHGLNIWYKIDKKHLVNLD